MGFNERWVFGFRFIMKIRSFQSSKDLTKLNIIGAFDHGWVTPLGRNNHIFGINQRIKIVKIRTYAKFRAFMF